MVEHAGSNWLICFFKELAFGLVSDETFIIPKLFFLSMVSFPSNFDRPSYLNRVEHIVLLYITEQVDFSQMGK